MSKKARATKRVIFLTHVCPLVSPVFGAILLAAERPLGEIGLLNLDPSPTLPPSPPPSPPHRSDQPTGRLALVFELMDMNIYELIRGRRHYVSEDRLKRYMYQLVKAMDHMHRNGIFHRDIKPENILIMDDVLKLADFGSCRGIYSKQPYTEYISTRWYRAPECLLTDGYYNYKMDMWGVGCVFFEIVSLFPLFPGQNELDQITKIHNVVGTPPPELLSKMKKRSAHMEFNFPPHVSLFRGA